MSFLDADVIPKQFDNSIIAGDPGQGTFGVGLHHLSHIQVGGNDRGFLPQNPFIDTKEKLRGGKGVGKLRPQIVNDQKIAVKNIPVCGNCISVLVENTLA